MDSHDDHKGQHMVINRMLKDQHFLYSNLIFPRGDANMNSGACISVPAVYEICLICTLRASPLVFCDKGFLS